MDIVTAKHDSITINGNLVLESGSEYKVKEVVMKEGWYGARSGTYYPETIQFIRLEGFDRTLFMPSCFVETSC